MDAPTGLCQVCYRTIDEITRWSRAAEDERARILDAVAERRTQFPDLLTHR